MQNSRRMRNLFNNDTWQLKKNLINAKQLHRKLSLFIASDLYQGHYQDFLIIYLIVIAKNVEIKIANLNLSFKNNQLFYNYKK